jgi:hypothetical protein
MEHHQQDHSLAVLEAIVTPKAIELYPSLIIPGTAILAENISIFISSPSCQRILNLHERCIGGIFLSENVTPFLTQRSTGHEDDFFEEEEEDE